MEVGLSPGNFLLDGDPAPSSPKGGRAPTKFSALVYCGQMVGWIKMVLGMEVGLSPCNFTLDGDPAPSPKGAEPPPQFSAHFYCGQTAGCIKMPLGMELGFSPGDFVLDEDPASLPKRREVHVNNIVEKWVLGFPKVKWLQLTREVGKSISCWCKIFSEFNIPKSLKSVNFLTDLFKKIKRVQLLRHGVYFNFFMYFLGTSCTWSLYMMIFSLESLVCVHYILSRVSSLFCNSFFFGSQILSQGSVSFCLLCLCQRNSFSRGVCFTSLYSFASCRPKSCKNRADSFQSGHHTRWLNPT